MTLSPLPTRLENCVGRRNRQVIRRSQTISIAGKLSEPYATLVLLLAVTRLHIGKAVATKWSDFDGDVLHVRRLMYHAKFDTTKGRDSKRRIPILLAPLEGLKAPRFDGRGRVPLNPGKCREALRSSGHERTQHQPGRVARFRHTVALSITPGTAQKIVSELLGHSDISITLRTYDHGEPNTLSSGAERSGEGYESDTRDTV